MTDIQKARAALETYVVACILQTEIFNGAKLRFLEDRIEQAIHDLEVRAPF